MGLSKPIQNDMPNSIDAALNAEQLRLSLGRQLHLQNSAPNEFDVIVLGVGSMGAASCYFLAKQGLKVLGLEQFEIPHELGSHGGQSRIIRKAYFEHPDYVQLLERAYHNWHSLELETSQRVYYPTGLLYVGRPNHLLITGVQESARKYRIPVEQLSLEETAKRHPPFQVPLGMSTLFEPDAGFLTPDKAILLYSLQALRHGAHIHTRERTIEWHRYANGFQVNTDKGSYRCKKLAITAGAWASELLPELGTKLRVTKQILGWFQPKKPAVFELGTFPCWVIADEDRPGVFYGFPSLPQTSFGAPSGLKLAYHFPGQEVDPNSVDRNIHESDQRHLVDFLNTYIPDGHGCVSAMKTCLYTCTPDENFIIDYLPGYQGEVAVATGFSGHGFKFTSMVGEVISDLIVKGKTEQPIDFLSFARFAR
jgi:sarcosine oxidase